MRRKAQALAVTLTVTLMFAACATIGPPLPPSLDLPKPPLDLRAVRKGNRVTLAWTIPATTTDRQLIRSLGPTRICRATTALTECGTPIAETTTPSAAAPATTKQKPRGSYEDQISNLVNGGDSDIVTYAVEVLNTEGRGAGLSNQVSVPLVRTLAAPREFQAHADSHGVVLSWSSDPAPAEQQPGLHYLYRVYRHTEDGKGEVLAGELEAATETSFILTDSTIEWQKTYEYHAEAVTLIDAPGKRPVEIEGDDTPEVKIFADDVFPPAVPTALQAVFSGPGQKSFVDLVWAPVSDVDLAGYNVYRHEGGSVPVKVTPELVKTPAYRDASVASGKHYVYSVSSVDVRGNESARSEEADETVP